ncbi:hypothetical protein AALO_G00122870, partial [Alosa alosa]
ESSSEQLISPHWTLQSWAPIPSYTILSFYTPPPLQNHMCITKHLHLSWPNNEQKCNSVPLPFSLSLFQVKVKIEPNDLRGFWLWWRRFLEMRVSGLAQCPVGVSRATRGTAGQRRWKPNSTHQRASRSSGTLWSALARLSNQSVVAQLAQGAWRSHFTLWRN